MSTLFASFYSLHHDSSSMHIFTTSSTQFLTCFDIICAVVYTKLYLNEIPPNWSTNEYGWANFVVALVGLQFACHTSQTKTILCSLNLTYNKNSVKIHFGTVLLPLGIKRGSALMRLAINLCEYAQRNVNLARRTKKKLKFDGINM